MTKDMDNQETMRAVSPQEVWELKGALNREHAPLPDMQSEWERLSMRMGLSEEQVKEPQEMTVGMHSHGITTKIMYFVSGIAATLATLFIINLFNKTGATSVDDEFFFTANNDQQEVILTDTKGKSQTLSEPSLAFKESKQSDVTQTQKTKKQKLLALTTPRGKDYQVTLADGTKVWMNAESKLEFPETFTGNTREVILHGEAYFEVAKDAAHPFIVKTDYFQTKVLGTTFNVKAYSNKDANIVLIEGHVKVLGRGKKEIILKPGQQAVLNAQHTNLSIREVDTYPYTQWREGFFYFEKQTLFEIMQELGRWYNVNIAFDNPEKMDIRLHYVCNRSQSIADAVRYLDAMGVVSARYEDGVVTIK